VKSGRSPQCNTCKSTNSYTIDGDTVLVDVSTPSHPNTRAIIDIDDLGKVIDGISRWHAAKAGNGLLYVYRKHQSQKLHRLILGFPDGLEVDHVNGDSLDNRKSNLRSVTRKENARNTKLYSDNKTGHSGVCVVKGRYAVYAVIEDKNTYLGTYDNLGDAIEARVRHGDCYHQNHGRKEAV
jgi:hypothetical protein